MFNWDVITFDRSAWDDVKETIQKDEFCTEHSDYFGHVICGAVCFDLVLRDCGSDGYLFCADPYILGVSDDGEAERERLEAQLQSVKRRQSVLHDRALADRYTAQLREKKAALDSKEKTILDALAKLEKKNPADDLKRAVVKRGVRESFTESDEKLFTAFVDHAVLWSKEKAQFHFTCGLVVEEDMRVRKVGRSYTEVPVITEFDEKGAFTWQ